MIINSRQPRPVDQLPDPQKVLESMLIAHFKKPIETIRAEVEAAEKFDLSQPLEPMELV